jgi:hypothetical protein
MSTQNPQPKTHNSSREAFYAGYHARSIDLRWNVPLQQLEHDALESFTLWQHHDDQWAREKAQNHEDQKQPLGHKHHAAHR